MPSSTVSGATFSGPLDPYVPSVQKPWNARRVHHLYKRLGFGATHQQVQDGLQMSPGDLVDKLFADAADLGPPDPPFWAGWTQADYDATGSNDLVFTHRDELRRRWLGDMLNEGIRAKMALFWHNHFVTEIQVVGCNAYFWDYWSLIHEYALGNFRTFAREMGKNSAMLVYLNGNISIAGEPNENYARELMELFTMGESNGYTQSDIVEMARALTGWRAKDYECTPAYYDATLHDNTPKTIFGQTANYNFNQVHNLIFSARAAQVSHFIPEKIYKNFVYQTPDNQVVAGLAQTFQDSGWELLPVLKQLFKSEHFFEDRYLNARLKSPMETFVPLLKLSGGEYPTNVSGDLLDGIGYWGYELGQELFNPPNVAGWPGNRHWVNESTLTGRWRFNAYNVYELTQNETIRENLRSLAIALSNDSNDPEIVTRALVEHFLNQDLEPVHLTAAVLNFKSGIPENYFLDGSWNLYWNEAPYQIQNLLYYLILLPEFQLT